MNYVISIINPEALDTLCAICAELKLPMTVVMHGRGTAVQSMMDLLGIESNEKRVVLTVADSDKTKQLIADQRRRLHLGVPGHGIVIAVPVKSIGGGKALAYLNQDNKNVKQAPALSFAYELIVAITNEGCTDMVMNAARAAGARGRHDFARQGYRREGSAFLQHHPRRGEGGSPHRCRGRAEVRDHDIYNQKGRARYRSRHDSLFSPHDRSRRLFFLVAN